ncbi:MAG: hypothetical protein Q9M24_07825 [Mariprofundaceae bacterium]|nr:hypothetical protein [Mariprofundaceae bacterium]
MRMTDQVNCAKVNTTCGREGTLRDDGFDTDKETSKDTAVLMDNSG